MSIKPQFQTHAVENQPDVPVAFHAWNDDLALRESVEREGGGWGAEHLCAFGRIAGSDLAALGVLANENRPKLRGFDRYGRRLDDVEFHPAYHEIMRLATRAGVHAYAWRHADRRGAQVVGAALLYMSSQADAGTACPLSMTRAAIPALRHAPDLADAWIPRLTALDYDPRALPAAQKAACTMGMGMTEKQGGSDVRSNTTRAQHTPDGSYELVGHKFFFSAPMSDAHLVLAQADAGLSCFLVPRILPDGTRNAVRIQRLKDKLGDWSNASSEVEFCGATGYRVGDEGRGVATILQMVALTRLDCAVQSAALMRQAVAQALQHTSQRRAFGKLLIDQPLMRNVLADLALESEAAVALAMRVARAVDAAPHDAHEAAFARLTTAVGKYWVCKRAPPLVNEAQECLGGLGYVEDSILPRLYRQAPLNSIWEGSGNVQCLDVLRSLRKEAQARDALFVELRAARGDNAIFDRYVESLADTFDDPAALTDGQSRRLVERIALALQAAILLRGAPPEIGAAFCTTRLGSDHGYAFGTLGNGAPIGTLLERAMPI